MSKEGIHRRDFMKGAVTAGAGAGLLGGAQIAQAQDSEEPAMTAVPRRELGTTGATVPIILMGGSQKFDTKYDKTLHRAFQMGVDYIDTAQSYAQGQSQLGVANFVKQIEDRKKVWITSKVALFGSKATPKAYMENMETCLRDLETDYLDMFFMHMINDERQLDPEFIKMGDDIKKSGKAKFFGFSCHHENVPEMMEKAAKVGGIDAIMFRYNFRQYGDVKLNQAMDNCKKAGIGLIAMKTQASVPEEHEKVVEFQSKDFTLPQAKLKSVWADERIDCCVSGMTNVQLLMENAQAAMSPVQLSMKEFVQLNRLAALTAPYYCRGCASICESKIAGKINIADALRYLMYHESYDDPETARLLYHALDPEARDYRNVDFAEAEKACPQGIRIQERLNKARQVLTA